MRALDGKMRLTDVINIEQALRLIQSIPSPRVEPMKLWLAQVGTDRLMEERHADDFNDPEAEILALYEKAFHKYKRLGKADSWVEARIQGIVTRKEFIEALKGAVVNARPELYAQTTEKLYRGLWDRTTAQLRGELGISTKQNPRDHFGEYALIYTRIAEKVSTDKLGEAEIVSFSAALDIVWMVAKEISKQARATSRLLGIDLVTEKPLLPKSRE
jgi:hypothetical protein